MKITIQRFRSLDKIISEIMDRLALLLVRAAGFVWIAKFVYHKVIGR